MYTIERKREYQREWLKRRRDEWIKANGPCVDCGSWIDLEVDHVDPTTKVTSSVWSWSKQRRDKELKKCVVRCKECHKKKTTKECRESGIYGANKKIGPIGTSWCTGHKDFIPIDMFGTKNERNGLRKYCKECRNKLIKVGKYV